MSKFICLNCYCHGFASDDDYFTHLYTGECYERFICENCDIKFNTKKLLNAHVVDCVSKNKVVKKIPIESIEIITNNNYIYIIKEREFIKTNENVYKIGRTKRGHSKRTNEYPKDSVVMLVIKVSDDKVYETAILEHLRNVSKQRKDIGSEYFEDNFYNLSKYVMEIIMKLNKTYTNIITKTMCHKTNHNIVDLNPENPQIAMRSSDMIYYWQYMEKYRKDDFNNLITLMIESYKNDNLRLAINTLLRFAHNLYDNGIGGCWYRHGNLTCRNDNNIYKIYIYDYDDKIGSWKICRNIKLIARIISNEFRYLNATVKQLKNIIDDMNICEISNDTETLYNNDTINLLVDCIKTCCQDSKRKKLIDGEHKERDTQLSYAIKSKYKSEYKLCDLEQFDIDIID